MTTTLDIGTAEFDSAAKLPSQGGRALDPDQARVLSHISDTPNETRKFPSSCPA